MITVSPVGMDTIDWVDRMAGLLAHFVRPMKISEESQWREWGRHVRQGLHVRGILTPDPGEFLDWKEWAARLNQILDPL